MGKETYTRYGKQGELPKKINKIRPTTRYIVIKFTTYNDKEETHLNSKKKKKKISLTYKGNSIGLAGNFSTQIWQNRREWHDIFKVLSGRKLQPWILYPAML